MENLILIVILILLVVFIVLLFTSRRDDLVNVRSQSAAAQTTVNVPAGSVVRIRHASDALEVEVSGHDQYMGPLSDASLDTSLWERITSRDCTMEEKLRIARILGEQGMHVTIDGVGEVGAPAVPDNSMSPSGVYPDDGPVGELVPAPVSASYTLDDLRELIITGLRDHLCTPAFARMASQEYGFELVFEDPVMRRRSMDADELRCVEAYRETMRRDLSEAMAQFSEDHPQQPAEEPHVPEVIAQQPSAAPKLPDYDFSKMK